MSIPGATMSGLIRPSRLGPRLEMFATVPVKPPVSEVPTERTFLPVDGAVTCEVPLVPRSPAENSGRTVFF